MRYYFNIVDGSGSGSVTDEEGSDLPNLEAARNEALASARDLAIDSLRGGRSVGGNQIQIADGAGLVLAAMTIRDVLQ